MAKDFDHITLAEYLDGARPKPLKHIASEFNVSVRTVQRRIADIRERLPGVEVAFDDSSGERAYWCTRKPGDMVPMARQKDVLTMHQMRMAASMFRTLGLSDYAEAFDEHVRHLMNGVPHAHNRSYRKSLERLAQREAILLGGSAPFAGAGIARQIRLALLAGRKVVFHRVSGEAISGFAEKLSFDAMYGACVEVTLEDGKIIRVDLADIESVDGIEDLRRDYLS